MRCVVFLFLVSVIAIAFYCVAADGSSKDGPKAALPRKMRSSEEETATQLLNRKLFGYYKAPYDYGLGGYGPYGDDHGHDGDKDDHDKGHGHDGDKDDHDKDHGHDDDKDDHDKDHGHDDKDDHDKDHGHDGDKDDHDKDHGHDDDKDDHDKDHGHDNDKDCDHGDHDHDHDDDDDCDDDDNDDDEHCYKHHYGRGGVDCEHDDDGKMGRKLSGSSTKGPN